MDSADANTVHLVVLVHGMWGNPSHLAEAAHVMREARCQTSSETGPAGERLEVLIAQTNSDEHTYDGIDWGAERIADETTETVERLKRDGKTVTRCSFTGYSLGGLIARYALGILSQRKFFETVTPVNFNTFATPHVGVPRYRGFRSSLINWIGPKMLSRTGEQFFSVDKWDRRGRPLLEVLADPDLVFFQTLSLFPHIRIYANAVNDSTVPFVTAAIETEDMFYDHATSGLQVELHEKYAPIVKSYYRPDVPPPVAQLKAFTPAWFRKYFTFGLPPPLQFRFPFNIFVYVTAPILLPLFMGLVLVYLSTSSHKSRARIRSLEKDNESTMQHLAHAFATLERDVENAVADMIDAPGDLAEASSTTLAARVDTQPDEDGTESDAEAKQMSLQPNGARPPPVQFVQLTDVQRRMIAWLNTLPGLKKELAFIEPCFNSHAVIVARDVQRFDSHKIGQGVLRHWADHFVM
ncbi:putative serine esterase-domain-containing protein [Amylocystis lapponica]|nr:putative serine esterase-domain-containing protein [Amylocystis lapponica]